VKPIFFAAAFFAASSVQAHADCAADIQAVMQAHMKAGPYHATMDMTAGGVARKMDSDVILPSSFHIKSAEMETIMLKQGTWMKMGGKWLAMPAAMSGMVSQQVMTGMESGLKNMANVQCEGPQPIEGLTLNKYEMDSAGEAMGVKATSHITMFTNASGLPQIMLIDGESMGHKSHIVQHITYDPSITIAPPK